MKVQLLSKQKQTFKCDKCNTKGVQLHRAFGGWPPRAFASLGDDWQAKFWQDAKNVSNQAQLEEHVVNTITRSRTEREETSVGGKYLPLSVYAGKHYDIKAIEDKCTDFEDHPILGRCYRVNVKAVHSKTIEDAVRKELLESKRKNQDKASKSTSRSRARSPSKAPSRGALDADGSPEKASKSNSPSRKERRHKSPSASRSPSRNRRVSGSKPSRKRADSRSRSPSKRDKDSRNRSRSPSKRRRNPSKGGKDSKRGRSPSGRRSPSRGGKASKRGRSPSGKRSPSRRKSRGTRSRSRSDGKRNRESERAERERKKAEMEAEKEKLKARTENQKKAVKVLAKISTILPGLARDCGDKSVKDVPKYAVDPAKKSLDALTTLKGKCDKVVAARGATSLDASVEELEAEFKSAIQSAALLSKLLKTAHEHA